MREGSIRIALDWIRILGMPGALHDTRERCHWATGQNVFPLGPINLLHLHQVERQI